MFEIEDIDKIKFFAPVVAGNLMSALYLKLLLKKLSGIEITPDLEDEILREMLMDWDQIRAFLELPPNERNFELPPGLRKKASTV